MDESANLGRSGPLLSDPRLLFLPAAIAPLWAAGKTANPAGRALPIVGPRQRATCLVAARLGVRGNLVVGNKPQAGLQPGSKSIGRVSAQVYDLIPGPFDGRSPGEPCAFVRVERNFLTRPCFLARCSHSRKASGSSGSFAPAAFIAS
jgi:hypothetical protein